MFGKYQKYSSEVLTAIVVFGVVLAFGSQLITSHQTTKHQPDICSGPSVATFTGCLGTESQITRKGFPFYFITDTSTVNIGGVPNGAAATPVRATTLQPLGFLSDSLLYMAVLFGLFWMVAQTRSRQHP
jgi:hypothetical protein